ncbi:5-oxoprolinase subunit PxpB [Metabacillus endolithicus]|uniref:5-oxoprolinase subunit PxpB n=1 Tax=Metabacillus endolithicus TaxID=1535204 RepID=A0ABW5BZ45_9BACI|nr:5-oxoprolinase subunit PxpB [Metabacillus endolithicus]UPG65676.1 5-oxoprolinase subunit PxpB [Metabacillus endolithicus]
MTKTNHINQENFIIEPAGDAAIVVRYGNEIEYSVHRKVQMLSNYLTQNSFKGFIECIPSYTSLTVFYDPLLVEEKSHAYKVGKMVSPYKNVRSIIEDMLTNLKDEEIETHRTVEIPVCYGGECGPDLEFVAKQNNLTTDEVISLHSGGEYLVYMLGFAPGFPFLGGMSEKIATPRRSTPRTSIPAGSVGIAGKQTGVYPISTPGGWQLIGQTPLSLFLSEKEPPSLLQAGDIVKFYPISYNDFLEWKEGNK